MSGKARVHELAEELGVESRTILAKLQELGEYVKSASSTVEAPVARRLRASFIEAPARAARASVAPPIGSTSRHDIEVAAAEARAAALRADPQFAVPAAPQAATATATQRTGGPGRQRTQATDQRIETSTDPRPAEVAEILVLWDELSALAPTPDRCIDHLARRGGLPRSDVERLRAVRNRCAHPAERGWPSSYDIAMALTTGRELRRRLGPQT